MKHSPGDWKASGNGVHVGCRCIATTHAEPKAQRDADAALIAAAPEMLGALERAVRAFEDGRYQALMEADSICRRAIAKAKGETP